MSDLYSGLHMVFNAGGTQTRVAISTDAESLSEVRIIPTNQDAEVWAQDLKIAVTELAGNSRVRTICGGIAGVFDEKKTRLIRSPHLPAWERKLIKKILEELFDAKVLLENDVAMEGLGEATMGAGRRKKIVGYVGIGTGVGGVKIDEGKISPNAYGFEPGHQIIDIDGEVGYFEDFVSGSGLKLTYGKKPEEITDPEVWNRETRLIAIGLHNVLVLWSPELLILGGSVMKSVDLERLKAEIREQMRIFPNIPEIVRGELGDKAGLYGALNFLGQRF